MQSPQERMQAHMGLVVQCLGRPLIYEFKLNPNDFKTQIKLI